MSPKKKDVIAEALADLGPDALSRCAMKSERIELRATLEEKASIQDVAQSLGLSVGEYLLALHRHAVLKLRGG